MANESEAKRLLSEHYHIPHIAVPHFFGRQKLLAELQDFLLEPRGQHDKPNVVVLQALGGQGKSQIALELCRRLRKNCRGVFWLDATSKATLERGFEELAGKLNQAAVSSLKDAESKVRFVLDTIQEWKDQWLMVYDNYDRPNIFTDIKQFLPESELVNAISSFKLTASDGQGSIIFTSRHDATKVLGRHVQVPSMANDGGIELLLRDMPAVEVERSRADGEAIVRRLGGLALAIEQAAAYISFNKMALPDFRDQYEKKKAKVLKHMREELWEYQKLRDGSEQSKALSAFTTWEMSFEQVQQGDEARKDRITRFLNVAAFLEPSHIGSYLFETYIAEEDEPFPWLEIFRHQTSLSDEETDSDTDCDTDQASFTHGKKQTRWSADQFWSTIERLRRLSLVQSVEKEPVVWFSIHPVISDWLQLREQKRSTREKILRETIGLMSVVVRSAFAEAADASKRQQLLAHLDSCQTGSRHIKFTKSLGCADMREQTISFGSFYHLQGKYERSEELYEALMKEDRHSFDKSDRKLLESMTNLAWIYRDQGRWKEAEELEMQVMEARKRVLGEEHPETLGSMGNLASTYRHQGRWKEAEELDVQVMEARKRVLGEEHPETLGSMGNLASTLWNQGRWKEAKELQVQVVEARKRVLGEEHPNTLISMGNLASTLWNQGRWEEAEELDVQVMEARKRVLGEGHPNTLTSMGNLASTYRNQGRWKEAEELEMQVMEARKRVLGEEHPETLGSMGNLASTYRNQGRWKEAEELDVQAMEARKRVLGEEHPETLGSMGNLASTLWNQGRWKEAEELDVQVMEASKRVLGEEHPNTLISMGNLASTYMNQGRWKEAEELEIQVMEARKRVLGEQHPDTLTAMANLAFTLKSQSRDEEALLLMKKCFQVRKRVVGLHHPDTEFSLETLNQWGIEHIEI
jgi:tetratricopeptide (TPR) repeat protein